MTRRFDHSVDRDPIEFGMGGEDYTAPPLLAPAVLGELLDQQKVLGAIDPNDAEGNVLGQITAVLADMFDLILQPESAGRVRERLNSRDKPFDLHREVMPTIKSLIEEYTGRPTQPSSPSQTGSDDTGTTSTAGAVPTMSTPAPLAVTAS